jgi:site-specific DNA recombinase
MKRLAIYARTSTDKQETGLEAQLMACTDWCKRESIDEPMIYQDDGVSGKEDSRPALDSMLGAIDQGEIDRVLVYSLNRLSRDLIRCMQMLQEFKAKGVTLISCTETIDLDSPEGRLLVRILAVLAEFQREDIVRKVKNGLENAKRKGVKLGPKQKRVDAPILELLDQGVKPTQVAEQLGITRGAVYRAIRARSNKV